MEEGRKGKTLFTITDISWDNMFLLIDVEVCSDEQPEAQDAVFTLIKVSSGAGTCPLKFDSYKDASYHFKINISQIDGRSFLENGEWEIEAELGGRTYPVLVKPDAAYRFQDLSRIFRYEEGKAYVLSFKVGSFADDREELLMTLESSFMTENKNWRDKKSGVRDAAIKTVRKITDAAKAPHKGHVLFMTETSNHISGNLKAVYDGLKNSGYVNEYKISVYARNDVEEGLGVKGLMSLSRLIADQDIILVDDYVPVFSYIDPPKGSRLVQLWHASVGFKSVGYSRFGREGSPHPEWSCHRKYTDVFVPHKDMIDVYREVFGIEKEAFKVAGSPRLTGFADQERAKAKADELRTRYPMLKGKNVVLFAPTYRGAGEKDAYYDYSKLDLKRLTSALGEHTLLVIKMHPFITRKIDIPEECRKNVLDMTNYPNINDLYYIADLLITDYSSDYFEFALLRKPVVFYTYDRDTYQLTRGVHRDVKEHAPGKVCDTFEELIDALVNHDYEMEKTEKFADEYGSLLDVDSVGMILKDVFGI